MLYRNSRVIVDMCLEVIFCAIVMFLMESACQNRIAYSWWVDIAASFSNCRAACKDMLVWYEQRH